MSDGLLHREQADSRLTLERVEVRFALNRLSATVHLHHRGARLRGEATADTREAAIVLATLDAIRELSDVPTQLRLVRPDDEAMTVHLTTAERGRSRLLIGTAPLIRNHDDVVVRATLDAVNRTIRLPAPAPPPRDPDEAEITAHQIRSPLALVYQLLETVLTHGPQLDTETTNDMLARALDHTRSLLERVDTLLTAATSTSVGATSINVRESLQAAVSDAGSQQVTLQCPEGIVAVAQPGHLREIAAILISNALQHGRPPVTVTAATSADRVHVVVEDAGPGIPSAAVRKLFRTRGEGTGRGIGLAAARILARANGGSLSYEPRTPHGSRFILTLPARLHSH